ncbi:MAG TPA: alpha/beta family hydrolase, partial [Myxococcaceae bacterium]|nr:alpha/beta family hydrolase [Myxococcaceae bacterium]
LGYPLHAPGQARLRDAHLPAIRAPVLIVQGERDAFGTPEEIRTAMKAMSASVRLFVVEHGDHSLSVPKSDEKTQEEIYRLVEEEISGWMASVPPRGAPR